MSLGRVGKGTVPPDLLGVFMGSPGNWGWFLHGWFWVAQASMG